jgi:hypothetical protein
MSTGFDHAHVDPPSGPRRGSTTKVLVAAAIAWGLLIILAAVTVPVVTLQAPPVTATAIAPPSPSPSAGASATPNDTGDGQKFLIGIVAVPTGVLLVIACSRAQSGRRTVPAMSVSA